MKIYFIFLCFVLLVSCNSNIYIVRHAEKSTEPKDNPHLTEAGRQRATDLKKLLSGKKVTAIYSTNTNRTKETATQLAESNQLSIQTYGNDTLPQLFKTIFQSKKNTLVVGHSNTVLKLLDAMQLKHKKATIADHEFDNLFIVKVKKYKPKKANPFLATLIETKYSNPSIPDSAPKPIQ
jgi:2,3-bisphosphoglycerate-dependent phosphoglycerate mutase